MFGFIKDFFKMLLCKKELLELQRYKYAVSLIWRWNGEFEHSAATARWIGLVGSNRIGPDIDGFREAMRGGNATRHLEWQEHRAELRDRIEGNAGLNMPLIEKSEPKPVTMLTASDFLFKILREYFGAAEEITAEMRLFDDLALDSLDAVELTMEIEERLDVSIEASDAARWVTVSDVIHYLEQHHGIKFPRPL